MRHPIGVRGEPRVADEIGSAQDDLAEPLPFAWVLHREQHGAAIRLILMDMTMPRMGGVEALREIRARGGTVPILLSTGYDVDAMDTPVKEFSGVLEKPYDVQDLWTAVERALAGTKP